MSPEQAQEVAFIAHTACGQMRADKVTPYIEHPRRVALLTRTFTALHPQFNLPKQDRIVAAYLHDVLEDTKLTREDLLDLGITYGQLELVEGMTKKPTANKTKEQIAEDDRLYYQRISESDALCFIKAADRCANLEDARKQLYEPVEKLEVNRWKNYADKTCRDVLPIYKHSFPKLYAELHTRLITFYCELPLAEKRRSEYVSQKARESWDCSLA